VLNSQKSTANNLVGLDRSELKPENDFLKESVAIYTQKFLLENMGIDAKVKGQGIWNKESLPVPGTRSAFEIQSLLILVLGQRSQSVPGIIFQTRG